MKNKLFGKIIASLAFVACTSVAQAATITVSPFSPTVNIGDVFNISIIGTEFTVGSGGTIGGGFSLAWDPNILTLQGFVLTFPGDQLFGQPGIVDLAAGTWTNADVTSFNGTTLADFEIATVTFQAINIGVSPTDVTIGLFDDGINERLWADSDGLIDVNPTFIGGSVTVVPVPAAVWLFGSGILGLIGVARRRNITQAA
jgi:hypothetical protein